MRDGPLRFGLVGAGAISGAHLRALASMPDKAQLVAIADIVPERAEQAAEPIGAQAYESLDAMLANADLDVVNFCTPPNVHADGAVAAMQAGKDVIVEKPADVSVAATQRILETAQETGRRAIVISQHRFDASSLAVHRAVEKGRFGRLTRATAHVRWWRPQEYFDAVPWRGELAATGGGALMSQSIHTVDLMLWFMGPVAEVFAYSGTLAHERIEVEDQLSAVTRFENGAIGTIDASIVAYPGRSTIVEISGDRGTATIEGDRLTYFHAAEPGESTGLYGAHGDSNRAAAELADESGIAHPDPSTLAGAHALQIEDFIDAIREDRNPMVTPHDALATMKLIEALYRSAVTGQAVRP